MRQTGFTRASTLGPIAEVIAGAGGSVERVFQRVDLPSGLLAEPDSLVPLRDHFRLLKIAGREVHDELFSARLGQQVTIGHLGVYGKWIAQAPTLHEGLLRANTSLPYMMQSATSLVLRISGRHACWSYELADPATDGRQQNEVLALSFMVEVVRQFLGRRWVPDMVVVAGPAPHARGALEQVLATDVLFQDTATASAIVFDAPLLATLNPAGPTLPDGLGGEDLQRIFDIPRQDDVIGTVSALIELESLDRYPTLAWVARKMALSDRNLQRHLGSRQGSFAQLVRVVLQKRAFHLLARTDQSVTEIAVTLGYSDAAHFSRAFRRWAGMAPSQWRAAARAGRG